VQSSRFVFDAKIWIYPGMAAWHFISLPKKDAAKIRVDFATKKRGWGSLPVRVKIGKSTWKTSIFPDTKAETYLLPLKAAIRKKENLGERDVVSVVLEIVA
jgi:hypothetical protein